MAGKKKVKNEKVLEEKVQTPEEVKNEKVQTPEEKVKKVPEEKVKKAPEKEITPKFNIGDTVFISNDADADLNGFKLFPQYKKYTYTIEAYEPKSDVYSLRRLNLLLLIKGELILAPSERAHDAINRKQY